MIGANQITFEVRTEATDYHAVLEAIKGRI